MLRWSLTLLLVLPGTVRGAQVTVEIAGEDIVAATDALVVTVGQEVAKAIEPAAIVEQIQHIVPRRDGRALVTRQHLHTIAANLQPESTETTPAASEPAAPAAPKERTLFDTIRAGGYIGVIIILLSIVAVGFIVEHSLTIRKQRLMPPAVVEQLEDLIAAGDLPAAAQCCEDPRNYSLVSEVVLAAVERHQSSEFGFAEYKSAAEEAGEEYTARLYRKTDALAVIGAIAPMLGLFGTVEGMMESFNTIASRGGAARPDELADSIGKALVTTWLGLIVAIPSMVAFSYFRNKIDSLVSECGKRIERLLLPLARKR